LYIKWGGIGSPRLSNKDIAIKINLKDSRELVEVEMARADIRYQHGASGLGHQQSVRAPHRRAARTQPETTSDIYARAEDTSYHEILTAAASNIICFRLNG
jgi:hypothetical protein